MRYAIASDGTQVAAHFGRCPEYLLVDVEDGMVLGQTVLPNPHTRGAAASAGRPRGAAVAGGAGPRALDCSSSGHYRYLGAAGPSRMWWQNRSRARCSREKARVSTMLEVIVLRDNRRSAPTCVPVMASRCWRACRAEASCSTPATATTWANADALGVDLPGARIGIRHGH